MKINQCFNNPCSASFAFSDDSIQHFHLYGRTPWHTKKPKDNQPTFVTLQKISTCVHSHQKILEMKKLAG
jgi:hypothetical protein